MSMSVPAILKYLNTSSHYNMLDDTENNGSSVRSKKRRLDHLTWEEKIQRKKLKNRVAAQTSRDRKKAKMEQMESAIKELFDKNEQLIDECEKLRMMNEKLHIENQELHNQLRVPCHNCSQNRPVECVAQNGSTVSNSQPKGLGRHSAAALNVQTVRALWKIVLACLLYQTCSTNSIETSIFPHLKKSRRASFKISPQTWRLLLKRQIAKYVIRSKCILKVLLSSENLHRTSRSVHTENHFSNKEHDITYIVESFYCSFPVDMNTNMVLVKLICVILMNVLMASSYCKPGDLKRCTFKMAQYHNSIR